MWQVDMSQITSYEGVVSSVQLLHEIHVDSMKPFT